MPTVFPEGTYGHMIVNTPGIVHFMRLNDTSGSGDDADSLSGSGSGVTYSQTGALVGDSNKSVRFDGSNDYITYGNNVSLSGNFSMEVWIKPAVAYTSGFPTFLSKENYNSPVSGWSFYLEGRSTANGKMRPVFMRASNYSQYRVYGNGIDPNVWTYLVATYDGSTLRMYQNGTLVWDTPSPGSIFTSSYSTLMGAATNASSTSYSDWYNGWVDEWAVYNVALSAQTISEHYNRGITTPITDTFLSRSESVKLYSSTSTGFSNTLSASETVTLRTDESNEFYNELDVSETLLLSASEISDIETAFGGTILGVGETVLLTNSYTTNLVTTTDVSEEGYLYSAADIELTTETNVSESPTLLETEVITLYNLSDLNKDHVTMIRRRQGFIHYAVQRLYNGNITIEFPHEAYAPISYTTPGALDEFELDESMLSDLTQQPNALSLTPFLVRTETGLPLKLGKCLTSWFDGLIVVIFYDDMSEHEDLLEVFGIFPSVTG